MNFKKLRHNVSDEVPQDVSNDEHHDLSGEERQDVSDEERNHIFNNDTFELQLTAFEPVFHNRLRILFDALSRYSFLYRHSDFLFDSPPIIVSAMASKLALLEPKISFSLPFVNPRTNIGLEFKFTVAFADAKLTEEKYSELNVNIRKQGNPSYNGNISLTHYLEHHKIPNPKGFGCVDSSLPFQKTVDIFLSNADRILTTHLLKTLLGEEWDPIPINWDPIK